MAPKPPTPKGTGIVKGLGVTLRTAKENAGLAFGVRHGHLLLCVVQS